MVSRLISYIFMAVFAACFLGVLAYCIISIFSVPDTSTTVEAIAALLVGTTAGALFASLSPDLGKKMIGFGLLVVFFVTAIGTILYLIKVCFGNFTTDKMYTLFALAGFWFISGCILTAMNYWIENNILMLDH